jgi:putative transposase
VVSAQLVDSDPVESVVDAAGVVSGVVDSGPRLPLSATEPDSEVVREAARQAVEEFASRSGLDQMLARVRAEGLRLTGPGGFLTEMVKAVLERGLQAELTEHLGYGRDDPAGRGSGNSRNGTTPKTVLTEVGPVRLDVPRDRAGTFTPALVPKGERRLGGSATWSCRCTRGG